MNSPFTSGSDQNIKFTVVIPARNEEKYIGRCLDSIAAAAKPYPGQVEVIVMINRCTDRTAEIAELYGAVTIPIESKNLSQIRNAGIHAARGEIIVTIDADSWVTDNMLTEIERLLQTGKYIGGGVRSAFERNSLGIAMSALVLIVPLLFKYGLLTVGLFWGYKKDFEAIGGFNEQMLMAEDIEFASRLNKWGKRNGKKYGTVTKAVMTTSCRKFDQYGDWGLVKNPRIVRAYLKGNDREYADQVYYEVEK
ncbi:glycosyltransferase [Paenibacillus azoreducens]|jgi:glycosyltransferase involved in cell wall biosynthesis|uniref:4,4'-diaponeurosporenoate glycosyltransferase n=1 Tax=Paenibacillus azoreducens TaxID=116718 RepID=A0A920CRP1_9BACL|nr:glycosyltransferase [Paenibacillus azoreducens]GIO48460.1 glycosyl transferase [Paenibacillus azoreducens]